MISAHGKPAVKDDYPVGQIWLDQDSNTLWVKHPHGWCDVINNRHVSETGGFYAPVAMYPPMPYPVMDYPPMRAATTAREPDEPRKRRVFDFE